MSSANLSARYVRRRLDRVGLKPIRSPVRNPGAVDFGIYQVVDCMTKCPQVPPHPFMYSLDLEDALEIAEEWEKETGE